MQTKHFSRFLLLTVLGVTSGVSTAKEVSVQHLGITWNMASKLTEDKTFPSEAYTHDNRHYDMDSVAYISERRDEDMYEPTGQQAFFIAQQNDTNSPESTDNPSEDSGRSDDC